MKLPRRAFLLSLLGGSAATLAYSAYRGVRLPTLDWDPRDPATAVEVDNGLRALLNDLILVTPEDNTEIAHFRAFAPEPTLNLTCASGGKKKLLIRNLASNATIECSDPEALVSHTIDGITHTVELEFSAQQQLELVCRLPQTDSYSFAAIGDTGGDQELAWCLQRGHQLGADFFLHLGDFNYQPGDYRRAIDLFNQSPIPVYVSIGNHDFHEDGSIYDQFLSEVSPLNHAFTLGKTRFINLDTAANFLPFGAGSRGALVDTLKQDTTSAHSIAYTHRPLYDPLPGSHHDLGSDGERDWLIATLHELGVKTLISGHIHIYDRREVQGIDNIVVGQGLGHQDLLTNSDYSKILLGQVNAEGEIQLELAPLSMPFELHCHPRNEPVKESLRGGEHDAMMQVVDEACG